MKKILFSTVICTLLFGTLVFAANIPRLINYQGMLTDDEGNPLNETVNITFKIYIDSTSVDPGDKKWEETQAGVEVTNGLFNVMLGRVSPLNLDFSEDYWLDITVGAEHLTDRIRFASVGYAYRAERADTAQYAHGGGSGDNDWDVVGGVLFTHGDWGIARCGSALLGTLAYTHVNLGASCSTGANGEDNGFCTVGGGSYNYAYGSYATVGGGRDNTASGYWATVGGGLHNDADTGYATIGGGRYNTVSGELGTVGGGWDNTASGYGATVGGGHGSLATGECATVGGGGSNIADTSHTTIAGGSYNKAGGYCATVGGGFLNIATGDYTTVGGGRLNTADTSHATVGGGWANGAGGTEATVGGGYGNSADGDRGTVGGGYDNSASGEYATVAGGHWNCAYGQHSTVPGGFDNHANGSFSFAAGRKALANHLGTFVWADSSVDADFASTGNNQFLIRAAGGVGIGTTDPIRDLHIAGSGFAEIQLEKTNVPTNKWHLSLWQNGLVFVETDVDYRLALENGGNVGIGTTDPTQKLDVNGIVRVRSWGSTPAYDVQVNNNGDLCRVSSSKRYKKNIRPLESNPDKILNLEPVSFEWKTTSEQDIGLIAEKVHEVIPELVGYDKQGRPDAVRYEMVSLYLLELVKGQVTAIRELKEENEELKLRIEALEDR